jgi:hypothetical protein
MKKGCVTAFNRMTAPVPMGSRGRTCRDLSALSTMQRCDDIERRLMELRATIREVRLTTRDSVVQSRKLLEQYRAIREEMVELQRQLRQFKNSD